MRKSLNRRNFFGLLSIAWITFTAALGGMISFLFRYLYPNVNFEPPMEFIAGSVEDFKEGVDETFKTTNGVWIVKEEGKIYALSNICTHLGCIPNWSPSTSTFECPCHGSGYHMNGVNFKGPAPRPLERYQIKLNASGKIVVNKTKIFREEKGQWSHPESFLEA